MNYLTMTEPLGDRLVAFVPSPKLFSTGKLRNLGEVTAAYSSSPWNRNAGSPVKTVEVVVGHQCFSMCSMTSSVPRK